MGLNRVRDDLGKHKRLSDQAVDLQSDLKKCIYKLANC